MIKIFLFLSLLLVVHGHEEFIAKLRHRASLRAPKPIVAEIEPYLKSKGKFDKNGRIDDEVSMHLPSGEFTSFKIRGQIDGTGIHKLDNRNEVNDVVSSKDGIYIRGDLHEFERVEGKKLAPGVVLVSYADWNAGEDAIHRRVQGDVQQLEDDIFFVPSEHIEPSNLFKNLDFELHMPVARQGADTGPRGDGQNPQEKPLAESQNYGGINFPAPVPITVGQFVCTSCYAKYEATTIDMRYTHKDNGRQLGSFQIKAKTQLTEHFEYTYKVTAGTTASVPVTLIKDRPEIAFNNIAIGGITLNIKIAIKLSMYAKITNPSFTGTVSHKFDAATIQAEFVVRADEAAGLFIKESAYNGPKYTNENPKIASDTLPSSGEVEFHFVHSISAVISSAGKTILTATSSLDSNYKNTLSNGNPQNCKPKKGYYKLAADTTFSSVIVASQFTESPKISFGIVKPDPPKKASLEDKQGCSSGLLLTRDDDPDTDGDGSNFFYDSDNVQVSNQTLTDTYVFGGVNAVLSCSTNPCASVVATLQFCTTVDDCATEQNFAQQLATNTPSWDTFAKQIDTDYIAVVVRIYEQNTVTGALTNLVTYSYQFTQCTEAYCPVTTSGNGQTLNFGVHRVIGAQQGQWTPDIPITSAGVIVLITIPSQVRKWATEVSLLTDTDDGSNVNVFASYEKTFNYSTWKPIAGNSDVNFQSSADGSVDIKKASLQDETYASINDDIYIYVFIASSGTSQTVSIVYTPFLQVDNIGDDTVVLGDMYSSTFYTVFNDLKNLDKNVAGILFGANTEYGDVDLYVFPPNYTGVLYGKRVPDETNPNILNREMVLVPAEYLSFPPANNTVQCVVYADTDVINVTIFSAAYIEEVANGREVTVPVASLIYSFQEIPPSSTQIRVQIQATGRTVCPYLVLLPFSEISGAIPGFDGTWLNSCDVDEFIDTADILALVGTSVALGFYTDDNTAGLPNIVYKITGYFNLSNPGETVSDYFDYEYDKYYTIPVAENRPAGVETIIIVALDGEKLAFDTTVSNLPADIESFTEADEDGSQFLYFFIPPTAAPIDEITFAVQNSNEIDDLIPYNIASFVLYALDAVDTNTAQQSVSLSATDSAAFIFLIDLPKAWSNGVYIKSSYITGDFDIYVSVSNDDNNDDNETYYSSTSSGEDTIAIPTAYFNGNGTGQDKSTSATAFVTAGYASTTVVTFSALQPFGATITISAQGVVTVTLTNQQYSFEEDVDIVKAAIIKGLSGSKALQDIIAAQGSNIAVTRPNDNTISFTIPNIQSLAATTVQLNIASDAEIVVPPTALSLSVVVPASVTTAPSSTGSTGSQGTTGQGTVTGKVNGAEHVTYSLVSVLLLLVAIFA